MAGNQIKLTFAGDSADAAKSFDKLGKSSKSFGKDISSASKDMGRATQRVDALGESADQLDTRAMGFRDTLTGVQDLSAGLKQLDKDGKPTIENMLLIGYGVGDLASGVANLGAPLLKMGAQWVATFASMAVSTVTSIATQIASWIALGISSLIGAAQVAAAWLLSIAPIALVIIAVVALVVLIIKNWDTIKEWTIKIFKAVWEFIKKAFEVVKKLFMTYVNFYISIYKGIWTGIKWVWDTITTFIGSTLSAVGDKITGFKNRAVNIIKQIPSAIRSILSGTANAITGPFKNGFQGIRRAWNSTVGGKGFSVPSWVPEIGGRSFRIPKLAKGGIVTKPTIAQVGEAGPEAVIPLSKRNAMRSVLEIRSGGSRLDDLLVDILRKAIANQGGDVQVVLGR